MTSAILVYGPRVVTFFLFFFLTVNETLEWLCVLVYGHRVATFFFFFFFSLTVNENIRMALRSCLWTSSCDFFFFTVNETLEWLCVLVGMDTSLCLFFLFLFLTVNETLEWLFFLVYGDRVVTFFLTVNETLEWPCVLLFMDIEL